ncbi:MAG: hypothetical protein ACRDC9_00205, partial [Plesiomonas shigelloides]
MAAGRLGAGYPAIVTKLTADTIFSGLVAYADPAERDRTHKKSPDQRGNRYTELTFLCLWLI